MAAPAASIHVRSTVRTADAVRTAGPGPLHVIDPEPFDRSFLNEICALATEVRTIAKRREGRTRLQTLLCDRRAMLYFTQPSTRTFLSFNNACHILGIRTSEIRDPATSSEVKGESLEDSIRTFSSYVDVIIMRSREAGLAARAARMMDSIPRPVPIVNAGSGPDQHPTQADPPRPPRRLHPGSQLRRTGRDRGPDDRHDGRPRTGRTVRSLCHLLRHYPGVRLKFISPAEFRMRPDVKRLLDRHGIEFEETDAPGDVLPELDALYLTRLQSEYDRPAEHEARPPDPRTRRRRRGAGRPNPGPRRMTMPDTASDRTSCGA